MPKIDQLIDRINAAFTASEEKIRAFQTQQVEVHQDRQKRLEEFDRLLDELKDIWRPRLDALARRFGEKVNVEPSVTPGRREASFKFDSELARINLRFSAMTDAEVRNAVFVFNLGILPILMKFESHSEISFHLNAVDKEKLAQWFDDRIVSFVNTYLSLHENAYYLKGHLVQDPVTKMQFPKYAAGAVAEIDGKKVYFISEETSREFAKQRAAK
jgi:YHS domain-containing protein